MPFHPPFNSPYFYNNYNKRPAYHPNLQKPYPTTPQPNCDIPPENEKEIKNPETSDKGSESSDYFFEILGLKLHFDDVLIICILFCLYKEGVHDVELFICLILLLLA